MHRGSEQQILPVPIPVLINEIPLGRGREHYVSRHVRKLLSHSLEETIRCKNAEPNSSKLWMAAKVAVH